MIIIVHYDLSVDFLESKLTLNAVVCRASAHYRLSAHSAYFAVECKRPLNS